MAKGRGRAKRVQIEDIVPPTDEQMSGGAFSVVETYDKTGATSRRIGSGYRRTPVIDTLSEYGIINDREHKALARYRDLASACDRSPLKDSVRKLMRVQGGSGDHISARLINAQLETARIEREAGSLKDILRAVAVDDVSLTQWAIAQGGSVEKCRIVTVKMDGQTRTKIKCRIEARAKALEIARLEIRMAAQRVISALD